MPAPQYRSVRSVVHGTDQLQVQANKPFSRAQVAIGSRKPPTPPRRIAVRTGRNVANSTCANIAFIGRIALAGIVREVTPSAVRTSASNGLEAASPQTETGTDASFAAVTRRSSMSSTGRDRKS